MQKNNKQNEQYLYHFTSTYHLPKIMQSGYLKLTPGGLKEPKNVRIENGVVIDDNMNYKPVVWLTDSKEPVGHGLEGSMVNKAEIRFTIPMKTDYQYWIGWANKNLMNKKWQKLFVSLTPNYDTWYISENIISLSDVLKIENVRTGEIIWSRDNDLTSSLIKPVR